MAFPIDRLSTLDCWISWPLQDPHQKAPTLPCRWMAACHVSPSLPLFQYGVVSFCNHILLPALKQLHIWVPILCKRSSVSSSEPWSMICESLNSILPEFWLTEPEVSTGIVWGVPCSLKEKGAPPNLALTAVNMRVSCPFHFIQLTVSPLRIVQRISQNVWGQHCNDLKRR